MSFIRIAALLVLVVVPQLSGCQGCNTRGLRRFGSTCGTDSECSGGVCFRGRCTKSCKADGDCAGGICIEQICQTPDDDYDGDGLSNGDELAIGTKPNEADSDGDGISDKAEVGSVKAPKDSNGDGTIDAIQSNTADEDGDCMVDAKDIAPNDKTKAGLPSAAKLCDTGVCADHLGDVQVICDKKAPTYQGVVLGCVGCQCSLDPAKVADWQPSESLCDSKDNDCDGLTDEDLLFDGKTIGQACAGIYGICAELGSDGSVAKGVVECGTDLQVTCSVHGNGSQSVAKTERCNYVDDDCDAKTDEDFLWTPAQGGPAQVVGTPCSQCGATLHTCPDGSPADPSVVACSGDGQAAVCSGLPYGSGFSEVDAGQPQPRLHWTAGLFHSLDTLVVYGGAVPTTQGEAAAADLWALPLAGEKAGHWTRLRDQAPGAVNGGALVYDADAKRMLLLGGSVDNKPNAGVWSLSDKHVWSAATDVPALPAGAQGAVTRAVFVGTGGSRKLVVFAAGKGVWWLPMSTTGAASWTSITLPAAPAGFAPLSGAPACVVPGGGAQPFALLVSAAKVGASSAVYQLRATATSVVTALVATTGAAPTRQGVACLLDSAGVLHVFGGHEATGPSKSGGSKLTFGGATATATTGAWSTDTSPVVTLQRSGAWAERLHSADIPVIIGGYERAGGGSEPWHRLASHRPLGTSASTTGLVDLAAPTPRPRVGAVHGHAAGIGLCVAGGLTFDLPDEGASKARVVPVTDAWCADDKGTWKRIAKDLPPMAFAAGGVDPGSSRLVIAGGLALNASSEAVDAWRIWRASLSYHKNNTTVPRPKVTDKVRLLDLKTGALTEHPVAGPKLGLASSVIDRTRRRLLIYGGVDDAKPLDGLWALDLDTMSWTDLAKTYPSGVDRPLAGYGQIITYLPAIDALLLAGGVSYDQAGGEAGTWQITYQTLNGSKQVVPGNPCYGADKTVLWSVPTLTTAQFKPLAVPTYADVQPGQPPKQPLLQLHFGQPAGAPVLFDTAGSTGFVALQLAPRFASKDDKGDPCPGLPSAKWTDTSVQLRLTIGSCNGQPQVFLEPGELSPMPTSMAWAAGAYDDGHRRSWVWSGLDADERLGTGLWAVEQTCASPAP